jgi:hypothetical protein
MKLTVQQLAAPTMWPARRVTLSFSHPSSGDVAFMPMMLAAHVEFVSAWQARLALPFLAREKSASPDDHFTASNGVVIDWHTPEVLDDDPT